MKFRKLYTLLLTAVLALCLLPASALAAETQGEEKTLTNEKDGVIYNAGDTVFNDGGVIYNNGGVVYNNGGVVYNNGGTVYNNGGVAYNNGGTVYNNGGTVYNNEGVVHSHGGSVKEGRADGKYVIDTATDYSAYADFSGAEDSEDGWLLEADGECTVTPKAGLSIIAAESSAGELAENEDGTYTISKLDMSAMLTLAFKLEAPGFGVESGTYGSDIKVELTAAEGAAIYYTLDGTDPDETSKRYEQPIELDDSTGIRAVAVMDGVETSKIAEAAYALPELATPVFKTQTEGYKQPKAQGLKLENHGDVDAVIKSVALDGETPEAFLLNTGDGGVVEAGKSDESTWTLQPAAELKPGAYSARVTVTFDSGDTTVLFVSFKVSEKA